MKKSILLIILTLSSVCGYGQKVLIDSLRHVVTLPNVSAEQRVRELADLGFVLRYIQPKEAIDFGEKAVQLSHTLSDKKYGSYAWARLYYCYRTADSISLTLGAVDSVMWYAQHSDSRIALGNAYRIKGNYAYATGDRTGIFENLLKALELLENSDNLHEMAHICYMLSGSFSVQNDWDNAEKYARFSDRLAHQTSNPDVQCLTGLSMSNFFIIASAEVKVRQSWI